MVEVATIFGPDFPDQALPKIGCVRSVCVSGKRMSLEHMNIPDTFANQTKHTFEPGVSGANNKCVQEIFSDQCLVGKDTKHTGHRRKHVQKHLRAEGLAYDQEIQTKSHQIV